MRLIAHERGQWSGVPLPMENQRIVIEPRYPQADLLMKIGQPEKEDVEDPNVRVRNIFWSTRYRCDIYVYEENGRVKKVPVPRRNPIDRLINTMDVSHAWGIEQEGRAVQTLGELIGKHHIFKMYLLTGLFVETGKSGVIYIFRRLRPTIAIRPTAGAFKGPGNGFTFLAALCMHPIGYYQESWGGAMCPTDDVIAHLTMMRADEHLYWRRCNQHTMTQPESGI